MPFQKNSLTIKCPAKINLALSIGSANQQSMHPISSWMIATKLTDTLEIQKTDNPTAPQITFATSAPQPSTIDWPIEKDLAHRAHQLLENHIGKKLSINWSLTKQIPTGAGLAGGSSNAAAMFVALNKLFNLNIPLDTLSDLAHTLGSDIPFLLHAIQGCTSAIVTNLGKTITPAPYKPTLPLILVLPPIHCSTPNVFKAFDKQDTNQQTPADTARVTQLATQPFIQQHQAFNNLAPAAYQAYPQLQKLQQELQAHLNIPVNLSGSGSTLFILGAGDTSTKLILKKTQAFTNLPTLKTTLQRYNPTT